MYKCNKSMVCKKTYKANIDSGDWVAQTAITTCMKAGREVPVQSVLMDHFSDQHVCRFHVATAAKPLYPRIAHFTSSPHSRTIRVTFSSLSVEAT